MDDNILNNVISLCKRRGFIFAGSEIYGGLANSWDYGPMGVELKNNIKAEWWRRFVQRRSDMVGIDGALLMNPKVWHASGHLSEFSDPLVEDKKTHTRFRLDHLLEGQGIDVVGMSFDDMVAQLKKLKLKSPAGNELTAPKQFNLMLKTFLGPTEEDANVVYFRPETAQAMFVNFKNVLDTTRQRVPFGIAQIGKAFRNEITPGNFIFRMREFEQMEIEYFVRQAEWEKWFEYWLGQMKQWMEDLGMSAEKLHFEEIPESERAHYSARTVDIEYDFPFGKKELYGIAYRGDFDLTTHTTHSGADLSYTDPETKESFVPHVVEPTFGVDRTVLAALLEAYTEEQAPTAKEGETEARVVMKFPSWLAPVKVAVFPLLKNNADLVKKAQGVFKGVLAHYPAQYDASGAIGRRYRRQDEIGTPLCVTVDHDTLSNNTVTLRDRDSLKQIRVSVDELTTVIDRFYAGEEFSSLL
jgi:glycyl-tRNA synthetase